MSIYRLSSAHFNVRTVYTSSALPTAYYIGVALAASHRVAFSARCVLHPYMSCGAENGNTPY